MTRNVAVQLDFGFYISSLQETRSDWDMTNFLPAVLLLPYYHLLLTEFLGSSFISYINLISYWYLYLSSNLLNLLEYKFYSKD